jgi:hypothetical protein
MNTIKILARIDEHQAADGSVEKTPVYEDVETHGSVESFVTYFLNEGRKPALTFRPNGLNGLVYASTTIMPEDFTEENVKRWFVPATDRTTGVVVPGKFTSRFPLVVTYRGIKVGDRGTKPVPQVLVNVEGIRERVRPTAESVASWFASIGKPATPVATVANEPAPID